MKISTFLKKLFKSLSDLIQNKTFVHLFLFILVFVGLVLLTASNYFPTESLVEGQISFKDIAAPITREIIDEQATEELRQKAGTEAGIIYKVDGSVASKQIEKISATFELLQKMNAWQKLGEKQKVNQLKGNLPLKISQDSIETFLLPDVQNLSQLEKWSKDIFNSVMHEGVSLENLSQVQQTLKQRINSINIPRFFKEAIFDLTKKALAPNIQTDTTATLKLQEEKRSKVEPVKILIQKGQIIVRRGEPITASQLYTLKALGLYRPSFDWNGLTGVIIFALLVIILLIYFISKQEPQILFNDKLLVLLSIIILVTSGICRGLSYISGYWAPVAAASILATILLSWRLGILITIFLSIQVGIFTGSMNLLAIPLITGIVAVLSVLKLQRRWSWTTAGLVLTANIFAALIFSLIQNESYDQLIKHILPFSAINAISAIVLAVGIMPILESSFRITTPIKLIELSNPNEPLLQKLLTEAPGTYHHSLIVANLSQAASTAIGADPLLAQAGAFYHDVGKIKRSYFFVENQISAKNPHDNLSPTLSTLIIISHIKDGVELAKQYKLPEILIDFIKEHHGTSLISYFYNQALNLEKDKTDIKEEDFRYLGPKPQSKESAIVMLADMVEAAARSLSSSNPVKIENLVKEIIKNTLDDGQLNESLLSFNDLNEIAASFTKTLTGIYHQRIEYPEKELISIKKNNLSKKSTKS